MRAITLVLLLLAPPAVAQAPKPVPSAPMSEDVQIREDGSLYMALPEEIRRVADKD